MNILTKIENKYYNNYQKYWNNSDFNYLLKKISFLKQHSNTKYNKFYELIEKIQKNNYPINPKLILDNLTIISLRENSLINIINNIDYKNYDNFLEKFLNTLMKEVDFFQSLKDSSNKPLMKSISCLTGLACGDALGTTLEFTEKMPDVFIDNIVGGGVFKLNAGEWTDDTSMALCLSESLRQSGFDFKNQMDIYSKWARHGYLSSNGKCFDIGITTSNAIKRYIQTNDPIAGSTASHHSGNGSIMRLAPIPIYFYDNINKTIEFSGKSSITTHGSPECIESCMLLGAILNLFINNNNNKSKEDLLFNSGLQHIFSQQFKLKEQKVIDLLNGKSWLNLKYEELPNTGYVITTMITALWCFYYTDNFKDALVKAINLCGDSDTIGAVCGQLAGAYYGYESIPNNWLSILSHSVYIQKEAYYLFLKL
jgi:ADP-ribosyl-[dinitrogen reductase] hydrolase